LDSQEKKRGAFLETLDLLKRNSPDVVIAYLDESGFDDNEITSYAYSKKGFRAFAEKFANVKKRVSTIGAYFNKIFQCLFMFEGSCNREIFETYLQQVLLKKLPRGSIIVLDNASYHKGGQIKDIIESAGCFVLYLPPYSPDLNPIEHFWASFKHSLRKILPTLPTRNVFDAAYLYTCNMTI